MKKLIRSLKMGFSLFKYSLAYKMNIVLMLVFGGLGIAYEVITVFSNMESEGVQHGITNYNGIWMLAMSPLYAIQMMYGLSLSGVIQSSDSKRLLLVDAATAFKAIWEIICFAILAVTRYICYRNADLNKGDILFGLLFFGLFSLVISLYTVIIYRYTTIGYIVMLPLIILFMLVPLFMNRSNISFSPVNFMSRMPFGESYLACLAISAAIVIIDIVLFYVLSVVMYKVPLSEKSFRQLLSRAK